MTKDDLKEMLKEIEAEEAEEVEEETEEQEEESEEEETEVSMNADALVEKLGDYVANAITEAKGGNSEDRKDIKKKFFNRKNGLQGIQYPDDLGNLSKEETITTYFKALVTGDTDPEASRVIRALNEGTDAEGGHLVPEEFRAEVWRILPDLSVMRRLARILPMNTDTLNLDKLTAMPQAYWTSEYAEKATSSAEFGSISLTPYKLVCLLPVTQELVADAEIDLVQFIVELFGEAIAEKEDNAYFTGSGTGQPTGLMGALSSSVDAGGVIDFDDILDLIYTVPQSVRQSRRTAFVANREMIKNLRKVKDDNNNYIWEAGRPTEGEPERLYGYPIYEQNSIAGSAMVYGDFSYYIIGDRQQLTVATTTEGGDAWRRDGLEIKAKIRVDGEPILTSAFAELTNG